MQDRDTHNEICANYFHLHLRQEDDKNGFEFLRNYFSSTSSLSASCHASRRTEERVMTWRLLDERSRKSRSFNVRLVRNRLLNLIIAHEFSINWQALGTQLLRLLRQASNDLLGLWHVRLIRMRRLNINVLWLWRQDRLNGLATTDDRLQEGLLGRHGVGLIGFVHLWEVIELSAEISWRIYKKN